MRAGEVLKCPTKIRKQLTPCSAIRRDGHNCVPKLPPGQAAKQLTRTREFRHRGPAFLLDNDWQSRSSKSRLHVSVVISRSGAYSHRHRCRHLSPGRQTQLPPLLVPIHPKSERVAFRQTTTPHRSQKRRVDATFSARPGMSGQTTLGDSHFRADCKLWTTSSSELSVVYSGATFPINSVNFTIQL